MNCRFRVLSIVGLFLMLSVITADARHSKEQDGTARTDTNAAAVLADLKCAKCQNPMEQGFLLEDQGSGANRTDTKWVQGPVIKGRIPFSDIVVKVQRHVEAYRCTSCGYLELYARSI